MNDEYKFISKYERDRNNETFAFIMIGLFLFGILLIIATFNASTVDNKIIDNSKYESIIEEQKQIYEAKIKYLKAY